MVRRILIASLFAISTGMASANESQEEYCSSQRHNAESSVRELYVETLSALQPIDNETQELKDIKSNLWKECHSKDMPLADLDACFSAAQDGKGFLKSRYPKADFIAFDQLENTAKRNLDFLKTCNTP